MWNVESTLTSVKLPLGPDFVPDPKVNLSLLNLDVSPETLHAQSIKTVNWVPCCTSLRAFWGCGI